MSAFVDVFDFDGTIYDGDSTLDFWRYCFRCNPSIAKFIPRQCCATVKYKLGFIDKLTMKEEFYAFFKSIHIQNKFLKKFWEIHGHKIMPWYQTIHLDSDIVVSASPCFLLEPICKKLGVKKLIASLVDYKTGKCLGPNCYGEEKVKRFRALYPHLQVRYFYSDTQSDFPFASIAEQAFLVRNGKLEHWRSK